MKLGPRRDVGVDLHAFSVDIVVGLGPAEYLKLSARHGIPTLHAMLALSRKDSPKAIEVLRAAAPYELGGFPSSLFPVYVRGEAYLAAHKGSEAEDEFQKILDHRGIVPNQPISVLAHLQIGRAYAMAGDVARAKSAYQDFLTLWKDADPDIPILKQAKAEYAKLKLK